MDQENRVTVYALRIRAEGVVSKEWRPNWMDLNSDASLGLPILLTMIFPTKRSSHEVMATGRSPERHVGASVVAVAGWVAPLARGTSLAATM